MATLHGIPSTYESSLDELPQWKRELILRKRATIRVHGLHTSGTGPTYAYVHTPSVHERSACGVQQELELSSGQGQFSETCSQRGQQTTARSLASRRSPHLPNGTEVSVTAGSVGVRESRFSGRDIRDGTVTANDRGSPPLPMHHKGYVEREARLAPPQTNHDPDSDLEEFQYGPGIVSKLKNRYLSLAMRESRGRSALRKYSSLEDLLDEGPIWPERCRSPPKTTPSTTPSKREVMKRAHSVDSLAHRRASHVPKSKSSSGLHQALTKEVIIIEKTPVEVRRVSDVGLHRKSASPVVSPEDNRSQPVKDTVRQVKQIFEGRPVRAVPKAPAHKTTQMKSLLGSPVSRTPPGMKPALKAKPPQLHNLRQNSLEEAKISLRQVPAVGRVVPRSTLSIKASPLLNSPAGTSTKPYPLSSPAKSTPKQSAPSVMNGDAPDRVRPDPIGEEADGVRRVSPAAIENIRKESAFQEFRFSEDPSPVRPVSPTPTHLPPSPVACHRATTSSSRETQRVLQENRKNAERSSLLKKGDVEKIPLGKTVVGSKAPVCPDSPTADYLSRLPAGAPTPVVEAINKGSSPQVQKGVKGRWEGQENTLVFNFSTRTDTPNYIENDGIDLSRRRRNQLKNEPGYVLMPGYDGKADSSTDGDDLDGDDDLSDLRAGPPTPCNIVFEGDAVIINGRSNLQRQPKSKKAEISFDLLSTTTFEYPSENSLLEDGSFECPPEEVIPFQGLASYTPSKVQLGSSFELGVSRPVSGSPPPHFVKVKSAEEEEDHLRPADENETVTWSAESAPDMLF